MAKIGYIRVSTTDQNPARQKVLMRELGVDKIYIDKMTGTNANRPALQELMQEVQQGDAVYVESISRFARNTVDLLELVDQLNSKGVEFISQKEHIDTTTPTGKFMLTVFGAVAELERNYTMQRQAEGIAIAKKEGTYTTYRKGRTRKEVDPDKLEEVYQQYQQNKVTVPEAADKLGLSVSQTYRRFQERREAGKTYDPNAPQIA